MKLFAIITAALMTAGTGAYFLHQSGDCPFSKSCPVAKSGGCCLNDKDTPSCCEAPLASCETKCSDCCAICEECCAAGVLTSVSAKADCCSDDDECPFCASPTNTATTAVIAGASHK